MPEPDREYPVTVMSGKLGGSVMVKGDLPECIPAAEVDQLIEALQMIRDMHRLPEATAMVNLKLKGCRYGS